MIPWTLERVRACVNIARRVRILAKNAYVHKPNFCDGRAMDPQMENLNPPDGLGRLIEIASAKRNIVAFTGAGISTESGIPDYRGPNGVWATQTPPTMGDFRSNPDTRRAYWEGRFERYPALNSTRPNDGHFALTALQRAGCYRASSRKTSTVCIRTRA